MSAWDEAVNNSAPQQEDSSESSTRYTGVSLTLKGAGAYDDPWYVIHGADAGDILNQLRDPKIREVLETATNVANAWGQNILNAKGLKPVQGNQQQGGGQQQSRPQTSQQSQQAASSRPDEPAPTCEHGEREWKDFRSKAGNDVKGWFCTTRNSDCKPLYRK